MGQYNYTDELSHYGVLGMKWGVRRSKAHLSRATGSSKKSSNNGNKKNVKKNKAKEQKKGDFSSVYREERKRQKRQINSKRAVTVGRIFANNFLKNRQATLDGKPIRVPLGAEAVAKWLIDYRFYKTSSMAKNSNNGNTKRR